MRINCCNLIHPNSFFPEQSPNILVQDWTKCLKFFVETNPVTTPAFLSATLDRTNSKILYMTIGAQTGAATNLSAQTLRCEFSYALGATTI